MNALRVFWRRFRNNRAAVGGLVALALVVALALAGPMLHPVDPFDMVGQPSVPPGGEHLLGTDVAGRDLLAGLIHGGRVAALTVEKVDGAASLGADHPFVHALLAAGFHQTPKGVRLRR